MEKRVLLAIFLSFLVLYGYQMLFVPPPPSEPAAPAGSASPVVPGQTGAPGAPAADPVEAPGPVVAPVRAAEAEREIRVETRDVIALFTNRGARLKSWRLKRYLDGKGEPLELVATRLAPKEPLPFSLRAEDPATTRQMNDALYVVTESPAAEGAGTRLRFEYTGLTAEGGVEVAKDITVEPQGYVVLVRITASRVRREGDAVRTEGALPFTIDWGGAVGNGGPAGYATTAPAGILFRNGELERLAPDDLAAQPSHEGVFGYAGAEDHYFLTAAVGPGQSKMLFRPTAIPSEAGDEQYPLVAWSIESAAAAAGLRFYAGPKDFDGLAAVDRDLVRAINFGMFGFIVVPLLRSLNWINGFVGNYGWSIVILTIVINALMFPLRHKSVVSMRKMQEIQPEAKAIQERYAKLKATDPAKQKMNQELMALYRERGVNPASGCLPMLLQMPVFLAFFSLLTVAIELRGAPFVGWITDLSQPDPYFVIPVLMGLSQFWLQWMTPQTSADPAQQKMMLVMPLVMMVFFLWSPTGALIYWLVGNVWGIGQQSLTNYLIGPPNIRTVRPAAERQLKRAGESPKA